MQPISTLRRDNAIETLRRHGWLEQVAWADEVDSTNSQARRALESLPMALPALWVADRQTAGRGRNQNRWWSPSGCLMCSLALGSEELPDDPSDWPSLSLIIGVALRACVQSITGLREVQLKWPNDLYVRNRKLAGILIECLRRVPGRESPVWIVGVGLNVCVPWADADPSLRERATCMSSVGGRPLTIEATLVEFVDCLKLELTQWRSNSSNWFETWNDASLLNGRFVSLRTPDGQTHQGRCEGIDTQGHLLLRDHQSTRTIQAAEILSWDT